MRGKEKETCLVLFSGSEDSARVAQEVAASGKEVRLMTFDGGVLSAPSEVLSEIQRMQKHITSGSVRLGDIYNIGAAVTTLSDAWMNRDLGDLGRAYPHINNKQLYNLYCQTAMWCVAIARCKSLGIRTIAAGYRATNTFCVGLDWWRAEIEALARRFGIQVEMPLWDLEDDVDRAAIAANTVSSDTSAELHRYYTCYVVHVASEMISEHALEFLRMSSQLAQSKGQALPLGKMLDMVRGSVRTSVREIQYEPVRRASYGRANLA